MGYGALCLCLCLYIKLFSFFSFFLLQVNFFLHQSKGNSRISNPTSPNNHWIIEPPNLMNYTTLLHASDPSKDCYLFFCFFFREEIYSKRPVKKRVHYNMAWKLTRILWWKILCAIWWCFQSLFLSLSLRPFFFSLFSFWTQQLFFFFGFKCPAHTTLR